MKYYSRLYTDEFPGTRFLLKTLFNFVCCVNYIYGKTLFFVRRHKYALDAFRSQVRILI